MDEKITKEEKKKELEEMLEMTERLDDLEKAHVTGYVKGMSALSELMKQKKEAS